MADELQQSNVGIWADEQNSEETVSDPSSFSEVVTWGTDWTVGTIVDQLTRGNINLQPMFQRRDAWDIRRKSKFIESLMLGLPIPQIVLAEEKGRRGKYIVLDGKQRLLTLNQFAGSFGHDNPPLVLRGLELLESLNGKSCASLRSRLDLQEMMAAFDNAAIRCVILRNWKSEELLQTVFSRLNMGSLQLSPQELRTALHPGDFMQHVDACSRNSKSLQRLLDLKKEDFRMRDTEILLRLIAFAEDLREYRGDLRKFLNDTTSKYNASWAIDETMLRQVIQDIEVGIEASFEVFGVPGKKWNGTDYEARINRAVIDAQVLPLTNAMVRQQSIAMSEDVTEAWKAICLDERFRESIETTTKSITAVRTRIGMWRDKLAGVLGLDIDYIELPSDGQDTSV